MSASRRIEYYKKKGKRNNNDPVVLDDLCMQMQDAVDADQREDGNEQEENLSEKDIFDNLFPAHECDTYYVTERCDHHSPELVHDFDKNPQDEEKYTVYKNEHDCEGILAFSSRN